MKEGWKGRLESFHRTDFHTYKPTKHHEEMIHVGGWEGANGRVARTEVMGYKLSPGGRGDQDG